MFSLFVSVMCRDRSRFRFNYRDDSAQFNYLSETMHFFELIILSSSKFRIWNGTIRCFLVMPFYDNFVSDDDFSEDLTGKYFFLRRCKWDLSHGDWSWKDLFTIFRKCFYHFKNVFTTCMSQMVFLACIHFEFSFIDRACYLEMSFAVSGLFLLCRLCAMWLVHNCRRSKLYWITVDVDNCKASLL